MQKDNFPKKYRLLCVAHPDDETIFFGGLLQRENGQIPWLVVCVTSDGNNERKRQFLKACQTLKVKYTGWWSFVDRYEQRLPIEELVLRLRELPEPFEVYTHGIVGEYGHPHHQDVSFAVHKAFEDHSRVYSVGYNCLPEKLIQLTKGEFEKKAKIMTEIYGSETSRFLNVLPVQFAEGYLKASFVEVNEIYQFLSGPKKRKLDSKKLKTYKWLINYLPVVKSLERPF